MSSAPDSIRTGSSPAQQAPSFEAVFRATYAELRDFVATYVRSSDVAHELVQDLFLRVWQMQDGPDAPPLTRAYLFRAARNRALRYLRHCRVEERWATHLLREREGEPQQAGADQDVVCGDLAKAAQDAIDGLPERCRQVFMLSRHQQLTYNEIAQALGISISTVETQMWRALKALRVKLAPYLVVALSLLR